MPKFFLGIDQTGAINHKGNPKPLPCCLITKNEIEFFYLDHLSKNQILKAISENNWASVDLFICMDCVIGLPRSLNLDWRQTTKKTLLYPGWGKSIAQRFFSDLLNECFLRAEKKSKDLPRRKSEIKLKANSVFQIHPFQKNIQTGTFRFWKELAISSDDFFAPAVDSLKNKKSQTQAKSPKPIPIFEGYPSHSWLVLFQSNTRDSKKISKHMKKFFPLLKWTLSHERKINKDANLADALLLALTLYKIDSNSCLQNLIKNTTPSSEGSILSEFLSS